jgi:two-component system cell cycle sensor histidine kinase/response regulator CckA
MSRSSPARAPGILIIDDDPMLLRLLDTALSRRGFRVWAGPSGQAGLELYRRHQDDIDLVLLDVCMPGLDGPATLRRLREVNPGVRACLMSGHAGAYSAADLRGLGIDGFFAKPFQVLPLADELWEVASPGMRA